MLQLSVRLNSPCADANVGPARGANQIIGATNVDVSGIHNASGMAGGCIGHDVGPQQGTGWRKRQAANPASAADPTVNHLVARAECHCLKAVHGTKDGSGGVRKDLWGAQLPAGRDGVGLKRVCIAARGDDGQTLRCVQSAERTSAASHTSAPIVNDINCAHGACDIPTAELPIVPCAGKQNVLPTLRYNKELRNMGTVLRLRGDDPRDKGDRRHAGRTF